MKKINAILVLLSLTSTVFAAQSSGVCEKNAKGYAENLISYEYGKNIKLNTEVIGYSRNEAQQIEIYNLIVHDSNGRAFPIQETLAAPPCFLIQLKK